jgi:hypothetical protein
VTQLLSLVSTHVSSDGTYWPEQPSSVASRHLLPQAGEGTNHTCVDTNGLVRRIQHALITVLCSALFSNQPMAAPHFSPAKPLADAHYEIDGAALCATARQTLAYLNQGTAYDPLTIHPGTALPIPLPRIKATLRFICQNQTRLNDPTFIQKHFELIRWQPDMQQVKRFSAHKPLLQKLPPNHILMTKYYVHLATASTRPTPEKPYAIYALPNDEQTLNLEQANARPDLIRFQYGKQAILAGALDGKPVPALAYVNRDDLESALMQGTIVAHFSDSLKTQTFNVHRNNNIAYDRNKPPYEQDRYWYFKRVEGIKGYGKDADHKITVQTGVTFAADIAQWGLGKLLMIQYPNPKTGQMITRVGVLADTGGAFDDNLYQVDFLAGAYQGKSAFLQASHDLPDDVMAYFMVLKRSTHPCQGHHS